MNVFGWSTDEQTDWTSPFTFGNGIKFRLMGGDIIRPYGEGNWLKSPYYSKFLYFFFPVPILPFLSIKFGRFSMYIGFKVFGVDRQEYLQWLPIYWNYQGSQALCPSATLRWSRD